MSIRGTVSKERILTISSDSWPACLSIDKGTVSSLLAQVDAEYLANVHRSTDAAASVDILVSDDSISLWLGAVRLAVVRR
jgi:hypothetical protein